MKHDETRTSGDMRNELQVATLCTKIIGIQVSQVDSVNCDIFEKAERVRYMTSQLIGNISTKGGQH